MTDFEPDNATDSAVLERTTEHLQDRYREVLSEDLIERVVYESYLALSRTSKVRKFIASLTGNFAENRLAALAKIAGTTKHPKQRVLFVDVENAGRSQLAVAALMALAGAQVDAYSAGTQPRDGMYPEVQKFLIERGTESETSYPKPVTDDLLRASDYVVMMASGTLPMYPGIVYLEWDIDAPADVSADNVRRVYDDVEVRVAELWQSMQRVEPAGPAETT